MREHLSLRKTNLADETIHSIASLPEESNKEPYVPFIIVSLLIIAFNFAILCVALITIGTKGYDPYIHLSAMFVSVLTLGCIAAIHKFIIGN